MSLLMKISLSEPDRLARRQPRVTFEFNQRGHQRYVIGEVSAADGSIRHLVDEQTKTFIYYYNNYRYDLDDGKELLWIPNGTDGVIFT